MSINMEDMPVEMIEVTPVNPLISKCQIKICYVGDAPNRNRSVITKETVLDGKEPKVFLNNNKITKKPKNKRMSTNKKIETA